MNKILNKLIYLILGWIAVTTTLAEIPSWYPDNAEELIENCKNEAFSKPGCVRLKYYAHYLCCAKSLNIYSEDLGLNVERLAYGILGPTNKLDCKKPLFHKCAEQSKEISSPGKMIFETMKCILDTINLNESEENC